MDNYRIIYQNLPCKIKGYVAYKADEDFYTIILNCRLSYQQNVKTFLHELKHITFNDIHSKIPATLLEQIRHT